MDQLTKEVNKGQIDLLGDNGQQMAIINMPESPRVPFMHPTKFSELIGLSSGVVGGWIDQGYIPTVKVGKYRMINLVSIEASLKAGDVL